MQQTNSRKMPFKSTKPFNLYKQTIAAKQILVSVLFFLRTILFFIFSMLQTNKRRFYKYMNNCYGVQ